MSKFHVAWKKKDEAPEELVILMGWFDVV